MEYQVNSVKELDSHKHILLLYNDPQSAKKIEFQFIEEGLERGEHCIFATHEDPILIQKLMRDYGINTDKFLKKRLLHICLPPDPFSHPEGIVAGTKSSLETILKDSKPPYRIITTLIPDVEITEVIDVHIKIEEEFHANFENFDGSMICPYNIQNLEHHKDHDRIRELLDSHHFVVYA